MSDLVGNPEDRFSRVAAHMVFDNKTPGTQEYIGTLSYLSFDTVQEGMSMNFVTVEHWTVIQFHFSLLPH